MKLIKPIREHFKTYSRWEIILSILSIIFLTLTVIALYVVIH